MQLTGMGIEAAKKMLREFLTVCVTEVEEIGSAYRVGDKRKFKLEVKFEGEVVSETTFTI